MFHILSRFSSLLFHFLLHLAGEVATAHSADTGHTVNLFSDVFIFVGCRIFTSIIATISLISQIGYQLIQFLLKDLNFN